MAANDAPRFSVLVPAWNGAPWLSGLIESVLDQTLDDLELVISDNASEDESAAVVARYPDPRVRFHRWTDHVPIFDNFNRGLTLCAGSWVYLLPADDRLMPACLERIAGRIDAYRGTRGLVAVFPRAARVDAEGRPIDVRYHGFQGEAVVRDGTHDASAWVRAVSAPGSPPWDSGAFRRATLDEMGVFYRPDIPSMSADLEVTVRVAAFGDVEYVDEALMAVTGSASSHTPGRVRSNLLRREPFTPRGIAFREGLRAHEGRRRVERDERAAVGAAIARSHLRRATSQRILAEGWGRRGALSDVLAAVRASPSTVVGSLPMAVGLVLAPAWLLVAARERVLRGRESSATERPG